MPTHPMSQTVGLPETRQPNDRRLLNKMRFTHAVLRDQLFDEVYMMPCELQRNFNLKHTIDHMLDQVRCVFVAGAASM